MWFDPDLSPPPAAHAEQGNSTSTLRVCALNGSCSVHYGYADYDHGRGAWLLSEREFGGDVGVWRVLSWTYV